MRVLVTGAAGLIGSGICARLAADGHEVTALVRPGTKIVPASAQQHRELNVAKAITPEDWLEPLAGIDAIVNCAGVLQDSIRDSTHDVHVTGAIAMFAACERLGLRKVIQISAIGADRQQVSAFSESKMTGDRALMDRDLDWVVLRPSVVLGRQVYGASALMRGLASLPLLPLMPQTGALQSVQLEDVAATVSFFLDPSAPSRVELDLVGPERQSLEDVVGLYRKWLGWPPARTIALPDWTMTPLYWLGDLAGWLGWRPPLRTTARRELARGVAGEAHAWSDLTGIKPASLPAALAKYPSTVQERWFARLYLPRVAVLVALAMFWVATGLITLTTGFAASVETMSRAGAGALAEVGAIAGALADICVGLAIVYRPTARRGLYAAMGLAAVYLVTGTVLLPDLWSDPLGPFVKVVPIFVLHWVALAILEER
ncbi:NAD-dependent epimerase/dehydratase [Candidatus Filomicrobium marinum]|uniref:NAD-dependent epimerase/dehydratase n=1 Tax=Candidatus Filomicrobium marinum TaxID=1608628 RepID=A0A0D6JE91_9HYPH|nr:SDR family oxidoreductase [Candidatus Filomicrobium marinum]CFX13789.1 NAD-dependent epimerase/dehydratase [Candidatus Filomicrobium marinum]CPR17666.1 NAD-dependent epimerase/dehydratase [Candidatus Filomicrobium marinum]